MGQYVLEDGCRDGYEGRFQMGYFLAYEPVTCGGKNRNISIETTELCCIVL